MQSERLFEQAVALAAAFVSNGDIRLRDNTHRDSEAMHMLADLIPVTYQVLAESWSLCVAPGVAEQTPGSPRTRPVALARSASPNHGPDTGYAVAHKWLDPVLAGQALPKQQLPSSELQAWLEDLTERHSVHELVLQLLFAHLVEVDRSQARRIAATLQGASAVAMPAGVATKLEELTEALRRALSEAPDE